MKTLCTLTLLFTSVALLALDVTFRVDLSQTTVSPNGVHLAGNFQGWIPNATPMAAEGAGIYTVTLSLNAGDYQFKYLNGNAWGSEEIVPQACGVNDGQGVFNRTVTVNGNFPILLDPVCFATCAACPVQPGVVDVTFKVDMSNEIVSAGGVHLAGIFQNWDPDATEMTSQGNGIYAATVPLGPGVYPYIFINGTTFNDKETVPFICGEPDGFNGFNREIQVIGNGDIVLDPVCFSMCDACQIIEPNTVEVTFQVNMSDQVVSPLGVHIAGNFQDWAPEATLMTDSGNGIWTYTTQIEAGTSVNYKFINGNAWGADESVPGACALNSNRYYNLTDTDVILPPVCYGECANCIAPPEMVMVLFQVDMSNETVSPQGVHLAGSFQNWNPNGTVMTELGGGIYEILHEVPANSSIQFRFINGSDWPQSEVVPEECGVSDGFGAYNRELEVGAVNTTFGPVCFSSCAECQEQTPILLTFRVNMSNENVSADGVYVAGDFNNWDPAATAMSEYQPGHYEAIGVVNTGSTISYKFLNGPDFIGTENVPSGCGVSDGFGGFNRSFTAGQVNEIIPVVCFSDCVDCLPNDNVNVTFRVDMSQETISAGGVHIAGTFNGFSPSASEMTMVSPGVYSFTASADPNTLISYKYINGTDWPFSETVPFACGVEDGFGGFNRQVSVNASDIFLNEVCFGSCGDCGVGVGENQHHSAILYPNPAEGMLTIQPGTGVSPCVRFYDTHGKCIQITSLFGSGGQQIDVSNWPAGIYHYQFEGTGQSGRVVVR